MEGNETVFVLVHQLKHLSNTKESFNNPGNSVELFFCLPFRQKEIRASSSVHWQTLLWIVQ